ncbi:uncharacterized protein RB166_010871 [Leptodactylus fuscus]|uniref:uncharacterized protein LOC142191978 n=1 Tax=Leptodactylus fuscus TaxID=238119 RepID=UPI003F4F1C3D
MPSCIIKGCVNPMNRKDPNIRMHSFPKQLDRIRQWLQQAPDHFPNLEEWVQKVFDKKKNNGYRLCSQHFSYDCYEYLYGRKNLRADALPTIFPSVPKPEDDYITVTIGEDNQTVARKRKRVKKPCTSEFTPNAIDSSNISLLAERTQVGNTLMVQLPVVPMILLPEQQPCSPHKPVIMVDKATNTDFYWNKEKSTFVLDTRFIPKKNVGSQTFKPKRKQRGVSCKILTDSTKIGFFNPEENKAKSTTAECHQVGGEALPNSEELLNVSQIKQEVEDVMDTSDLEGVQDHTMDNSFIPVGLEVCDLKMEEDPEECDIKTEEDPEECHMPVTPIQFPCEKTLWTENISLSHDIKKEEDPEECYLPVAPIQFPKTPLLDSPIATETCRATGSHSDQTSNPQSGVHSTNYIQMPNPSPLIQQPSPSRPKLNLSHEKTLSPETISPSPDDTEEEEDPEDESFLPVDVEVEEEDDHDEDIEPLPDDLVEGSDDDDFEKINPDTTDPVNEPKFIVFRSCLEEIISLVPCQYRTTCAAKLTELRIRPLGSAINVDVKCVKGHVQELWTSQPRLKRIPIGNLMLSSAIELSDVHFKKLKALFDFLNIFMISKSTYYRQPKYGFAEIQDQWDLERGQISSLGQRPECLAGDGQSDSL